MHSVHSHIHHSEEVEPVFKQAIHLPNVAQHVRDGHICVFERAHVCVSSES